VNNVLQTQKETLPPTLADRATAPRFSRAKPSAGGSLDVTACVLDITAEALECPAARSGHPEEGGGQDDEGESFLGNVHGGRGVMFNSPVG
jgi:hypothetical protein